MFCTSEKSQVYFAVLPVIWHQLRKEGLLPAQRKVKRESYVHLAKIISGREFSPSSMQST